MIKSWKVLLLVVLVLFILWLAGIGYLAKTIREEGLKNIVSEIWEGEGESE